MDVQAAADEVRLGASLQRVATDVRERWLRAKGLRPDDAPPDMFRAEVAAFMRDLARHLGERCAGDPRAGQALRDWVRHCDHYEAWDALLTGFRFDGREALLRRGRLMFSRTLTAHWREG
ncbi:MAG: hypothetical protein WAT39_05085 [Planctomycetota bacterium]